MKDICRKTSVSDFVFILHQAIENNHIVTRMAAEVLTLQLLNTNYFDFDRLVEDGNEKRKQWPTDRCLLLSMENQLKTVPVRAEIARFTSLYTRQSGCAEQNDFVAI